MKVDRLNHPSTQDFQQLAEVLMDCVDGGASVSFMQPMTLEKALGFWTRIAESAARNERALLVIRDRHGIAGTVQVVWDLPENQPHRADISKMLVHRRGRRQGWGEALMKSAEEIARQERKTLLVLDTANDTAQRLYARLGWQRCGAIPDYALLPQGGLCATTYMYRQLN